MPNDEITYSEIVSEAGHEHIVIRVRYPEGIRAAFIRRVGSDDETVIRDGPAQFDT